MKKSLLCLAVCLSIVAATLSYHSAQSKPADHGFVAPMPLKQDYSILHCYDKTELENMLTDLKADKEKAAIADSIKAMLKKRGMNQSELARRLGVSRAFVSKSLSGKANLSLDTLSRIAFVLDCKIAPVFSSIPQKIDYQSLPDEMMYLPLAA